MLLDLRKIAALAVVLPAVRAFSPATTKHVEPLSSSSSSSSRASAMTLFSEPQKKGGLETGMRSKLVTESIAPWRTLRLFLYGSLGSGAFVGGLINTSGAIAGSNSPDFNLNTEVCERFLGITKQSMIQVHLTLFILKNFIEAYECWY